MWTTVTPHSYLLASNSDPLISIILPVLRHKTADYRARGGIKEILLIQRSSALRWWLGEPGSVHICIWLPIQYKLITLAAVSGIDKTNGLLSSQNWFPPFVFCMRWKLLIGKTSQTLPFMFQLLSCPWNSHKLRNEAWVSLKWQPRLQHFFSHLAQTQQHLNVRAEEICPFLHKCGWSKYQNRHEYMPCCAEVSSRP